MRSSEEIEKRRYYTPEYLTLMDEISSKEEEIEKIRSKREELTIADKEEIKRLQKEINDIEDKNLDIIKENEEIQEKISKQLKYQEKLKKEGVTLEDKVNHYLEKRVNNYAKLTNGISEMKSGLSDIKGGFSAIVEEGKKYYDAWTKVDQATANYTRSIGGSAVAMNKLRKDTISFIKDNQIALKYNVGMEEMIQLQGDYNKALGRSVSLTINQKETMAAMSRLTSDKTAIDWSSKLENFGLNPDEAGKRLEETFKKTSKTGLAFENVSKNFLDNIKMAQNYTFTNGLKGLESMARKATAIKLDMKQVASFADKVSTLEGAIETGANLSVLGGSFSQFANPLSMMYQGLNDMEGLQDRLVNMFGNLGRFNNLTGEIELSAFDRMRVKEAAKTMGVSSDAMFDMINAKGRRNIVERQINNPNYSDDIKELLLNTAQLNKDGKAFVTIGGKEKSVNNLSQSDIMTLKATEVDDSKNIKNIAQELISINEKLSGVTKDREAFQASIMDAVAGNIMEDIKHANDILRAINRMMLIFGGLNAVGNVFKMVKGGVKLFNGFKNSVSGLNGSTLKVGRGLRKSTGITHIKIKKTPKGTPKSYQVWQEGVKGSRIANATEAAKITKSLRIGRLGGAAFGGLVSGGITAFQEYGTENNHSQTRKAVTTTLSAVAGVVGAVIGAKIGTALGSVAPGIGHIIGAAAGALIGGSVSWISKKRDQVKDNKKRELGLTELRGDYSRQELREIKEFINGSRSGLSSSLEKTLRKNNEWDIINKMQQKAANEIYKVKVVGSDAKSTGGYIQGVGTATSDSNPTMLSNGEFVVNAAATKKYRNLLENINGHTDTMKIIPGNNALNSMRVAESSSMRIGNRNNGTTSVDFGQGLNINLGGTMKLDLGNGKNIGIKPEDILSPAMINQITKKIEEQINYGYNRETSRAFKF